MKSKLIYIVLICLLFTGIQDGMGQLANRQEIGTFEAGAELKPVIPSSSFGQTEGGYGMLRSETEGNPWGSSDAPLPGESFATGGEKVPTGEGFVVLCLLACCYGLVFRRLRAKELKVKR